MNDIRALRELILATGLEDLIALPEIALTASQAGLIDEGGRSELITAMIGVVVRGEVQIWSGPWPDEPQYVPSPVALELVGIPGKYEFNSAEDLTSRVYFVNVENLRAPESGPEPQLSS